MNFKLLNLDEDTIPCSPDLSGIKWHRQFIAFFHFVDWKCISFGLSIDIGNPNIEIHLPFGFIRIGWQKFPNKKPINHDMLAWRSFGKVEKYPL